MADFCKQCSLATFGTDYKELAGLINPQQYAKGLTGLAICEGCGVINVDPDGVCISEDCLKQHGVKKGRPANKIIARTISSGCSGAITWTGLCWFLLLLYLSLL
jgi:hypothetical protein